MPISKEKLIFGHSLIKGNTPEVLDCKRISEAISKESSAVESFGLFDSSATNYNTYYPDVTIEDLQPKDEDYVYPLFRALSNIIINKYGPIDFSNPAILKGAVNKLIGLAIFTNHEMIVGNEIGVIVQSSFQEAYTSSTGLKIPSGLNVKLKLDGKSNPKIARAIMGDPPSIHSVSVTVEFDWEPSHKFKDQDEFWRKLGTYDDKGKLITRKVTQIKNFYELSLVAHGADPYAQKINEKGQLTNPDLANSRYQFSEGDFIKNGHFYDYKDPNYISLAADNKTTILTESNNNNSTNSQAMNKEVRNKLIKRFSLTEEATDEELMAKLMEEAEKVTSLTADLESRDTELANLTTELTEAKKEINNLKPLSTVGEAALSKTREEAKRLYQLHAGDKVNQKLIDLIDKSSFEQAEAHLEQYQGLVEESFQGVCLDCQSNNVTRASSNPEEEGIVGANGKTKGKQTQTVKSNAEVAEELAKKNRGSNFIYGN